MRVQTNHLVIVPLSSYLIGSNDAVYIQYRALELTAKARICVPGFSFWIVRYIYVSDASNFSSLGVKTPWDPGGT